jgi:hypothetical protein
MVVVVGARQAFKKKCKLTPGAYNVIIQEVDGPFYQQCLSSHNPRAQVR